MLGHTMPRHPTYCGMSWATIVLAADSNLSAEELSGTACALTR